jgi:hypothetical protein
MRIRIRARQRLELSQKYFGAGNAKDTNIVTVILKSSVVFWRS